MPSLPEIVRTIAAPGDAMARVAERISPTSQEASAGTDACKLTEDHDVVPRSFQIDATGIEVDAQQRNARHHDPG